MTQPIEPDEQQIAKQVAAAMFARDAASQSLGIDVTVTNQEGRTIALFRGRSYRVRGEVIPAS
jgi:hypothetical protein